MQSAHGIVVLRPGIKMADSTAVLDRAHLEPYQPRDRCGLLLDERDEAVRLPLLPGLMRSFFQPTLSVRVRACGMMVYTRGAFL